MIRFLQLTGPINNPLDGVDVGILELPALADFTGDGELDLIVGSSNFQANFLLNLGTSRNPVFLLKTANESPFTGLGVGPAAAFAVGDMDGDGDLDFGASDNPGFFRYFENTGGAFNAAYLERTGGNNPFGSIFETSKQRPTLGDLDGDGDLDLVVGRLDGFLSYYENTGGPNAPVFVKRNGVDNPFSSADLDSTAAPTLVDLDGDLDLDLVVGNAHGQLFYFENTGSATAPAFVARTGTSNPFNGIDVGESAAPTFGDIDADGDADLIAGNQFNPMQVFVQNDAPLLRLPTLGQALLPTNEDTASGVPSVDEVLAALWSDVDARALKGLAITATSGAGTWQYSVGGASWSAMGSVSETSALLLAAGTSLRYVPDGRNGETATLTYRAWDQSSGSASTDSTRGTGDASINGGTTAFSSNSVPLSVEVTSVNDAPTLSQSAITLTGTDEDATSSTFTVAALLASAGWADVDVFATQGLAITGASGSGRWEFSSGGSNWSGFHGTLSDSLRLLVDSSAQLRYVPDGKNGETASLSFRAWDGSDGLQPSQSQSFHQYDAQGLSGGTSAYSSTVTTASLLVTAVNDAPTLSPIPFPLPDTDEDTPTPAIPVTSLLASAGWADVDTSPLKGIAITANSGLGRWEYNTGGTDWTPVGGTSASAAVLLAEGSSVRFVPDGKTGGGAILSFRAWDRTTGSPSIDGIPSLADTTGFGGSSAFSAAINSPSLFVTPVNDAPVAVADSAQTAPGTAVTIAVLANDSDIDGGPLTVSAITQGSHGNVVIQPSGTTVRYTPNAGFAGFDSFTYTANDGAGGTAVGTVRVLVPSYIGTAGHDVPLGTQQADFILAGDGNDRVLAYGGADYVDGGRGADTISGGLGADTLIGGDGADTFLTTAADLAGDSIDGGDGTDTLQITDSIVAMPAVFTLVNVERLSFPGALQVAHTTWLDLSALTLSGAGNQIMGGTAASRIIGTRSNDRITDSAGNDDLRGADGHDTIMAGPGQDTVYGGTGNDTLGGSSSTMGDGAIDTFVFNTALNAATNVDVIIGFEANGLDLIALDSGIFTAIGAALDADEFRAVAGGLAADANDFILYDTATGALYYDADGNGAGARVPFATLGAGLVGTVDAADFVVTPAP